MAIILTVLKIIGITLLSILGLLLFIILLVLFVPIRYEITAEKPYDGDFEAKVKITWLLHLLNILVWYKEELFYRVRVTLIPVYKSDNLKRKRKNKKEDSANNECSSDSNLSVTSKDEAIEKTENLHEIEDTIDRDNKDDGEDIEDFPIYRGKDIAYRGNDSEININSIDLASDYIDETTSTDDLEDESDKLSIIDKFFEFTGILIDFVFNVDSKLNQFFNKLKNIYENIEYYIEIIDDDRNRAFVAGCLKRLSYVLKHISPRKIKGRVHIGFEDAYDMGKMLSIYSVLFPLIHDKIQMVPDYDNEIMEGNILIKGRVQVIILLWTAFKIYFNKDFKRLKKLMTKNK